MVFRNKSMPLNTDKCRILIENEELERINLGHDCNNPYFKFVGIKLDEFLTFEHHIDHVSNKIAGATFALRQIENVLSLRIRKLVYSSIFKSSLQFHI